MVNALYDFDTDTRWTPYLGVGAGVADVTLNGVGRTTPTASATYVHGDGTEFAYQGIAGVSYAIDYNLKVGVDYRYLAALDHDYGSTYNGVTGTARSDYSSHAVMFGVRWEFGDPAPAPRPAPAPLPVAAPAPPPPPPPPAPAPEVRDFTVYFAFDSAKLDDQAKAIVHEAAVYHQTHPEARIALAGHTDLAGSADYNMRLSLRRADAVRAELIADGLNATQITVTALGETQPAVVTAKGVREPRNRRVVIDLK
jgi:outer membrane protein OmpA-like peptidoglycan-associated protein